jgi:phosphoribulokinase
LRVPVLDISNGSIAQKIPTSSYLLLCQRFATIPIHSFQFISMNMDSHGLTLVTTADNLGIRTLTLGNTRKWLISHEDD